MTKEVLIIAAILALGPHVAMADQTISAVDDTGIFNCDTGPDELIARRFIPYVDKKCIGKSDCVIHPLAVVPEAELKAAHCTGFFVAIVCGKTDKEGREFRSESFKDKLAVSCKK